jgi:hypothetical protein
MNNIDLVKALHRIWNTGDLALIDSVYARDFLAHWPASSEVPERHGIEGIRFGVARIRTAFPDWHEQVEDIFGSGDRVASRYRRKRRTIFSMCKAAVLHGLGRIRDRRRGVARRISMVPTPGRQDVQCVLGQLLKGLFGSPHAATETCKRERCDKYRYADQCRLDDPPAFRSFSISEDVAKS